MVNCKFPLPFLLALILLPDSALPITLQTINLGTVGQTYPVVEPDIVAELQKEAAQRDRSKDVMLLTDQIKKYQPPNLHTLQRAEEDRTFLVDMTYTLNHDLKDAEGKVIYPRGYNFNPLDYISFPGGLVVIDGDDPTQVEWFKKTPYVENHQARLLISNGYASDLTRQLKRQVFYLTEDIAVRLKLAAVPSVVVQQDSKLMIREIFVPRDSQSNSDE